MKLFKIWFKELEEAHPDVFHDEIDCAMAWMDALKIVQYWLKENPSCGELEKLNSMINVELRKIR